MSGVFIDGGGHDSINHGGDGIDHGGHDQAGHGISHGHGQSGHSFLAQILGLDQQDHAHLAHHGGEGTDGKAPSQTPAWNSALQGLKLENLIAGINITPNFLLFMLFASFVGWLGVIYWIRHHEPFANQVLGSSAAYAPTAGADRQLINDSRVALPIKTSAQSGMVYLPQPGQDNSAPPAGSQVNTGLSAAMSQAFASGPTSTPAVAATSQNSAGVPGQAQGLGARQASTAGQSNADPPQASSPVNQGLSAAMASALGPAADVNPAQAGGPQLDQAPASSAYSPGYSPAPICQQMMPQAMPAAASPAMAAGAPMPGQGGMRLFSSRASMTAGAPMAGEGGMRLFSSRRSMMAQAAAPAQAEAPSASQNYAVAPAPVPAAPVESANTWSLAKQGSGTFSADTAQFNSQFGAPLAGASTDAGPLSGVSGATEVTRLKVNTDK